MKKSTLLGMVAALFIGQSAMAQSTPEITYTEDPSQGYLFNRFKDNWFISAEGGINYYFDRNNTERDFQDRFSPNAGLWVGKWFSPIIGVRAGANFTQLKGLGKDGGYGYYGTYKEYDKFKRNEFGFSIDGLVNLTNWWCGYNPTRVYNAIVYGGAGYNWVYVPDYNNKGERDGWARGGDDNLTAHAGLINNFRLNKHLNIYLDLRVVGVTDDTNYNGLRKNHIDGQAYLGLTYNFNKTTWNAPVVPVIPPMPTCDEEKARLQAAEGRIADLERQLRDCLNRPVQTIVKEAEGPLCTIYYTIGSSRISRVDNKVLGAVAEVMKGNPDTKYTVCGWADNYTGSDAVNDRLRKARAAGVERVLLRNGVPASQLDVTTNSANLNEMGEKFVSLDRAVTIKANK
ncbi:MAG: OmpA family protein [Duncaniella sp.]|nr:OmpA family protein [Duncaniella sp.]MDE6177846.1 OmpA family protein [Duncaniella sp.]